MAWTVRFHSAFEAEFDQLPEAVQDGMVARFVILEREGPRLGRPHADTLAGSRHANMKELRCDADGGVWRIAFAFDPAREAIILVAADKSGVSQKRFYKRLLTTADARFDQHLEDMKG